eukprot:11135127-Karenia_brevis.AAC.1
MPYSAALGINSARTGFLRCATENLLKTTSAPTGAGCAGPYLARQATKGLQVSRMAELHGHLEDSAVVQAYGLSLYTLLAYDA